MDMQLYKSKNIQLWLEICWLCHIKRFHHTYQFLGVFLKCKIGTPHSFFPDISGESFPDLYGQPVLRYRGRLRFPTKHSILSKRVQITGDMSHVTRPWTQVSHQAAHSCRYVYNMQNNICCSIYNHEMTCNIIIMYTYLYRSYAYIEI